MALECISMQACERAAKNRPVRFEPQRRKVRAHAPSVLLPHVPAFARALLQRALTRALFLSRCLLRPCSWAFCSSCWFRSRHPRSGGASGLLVLLLLHAEEPEEPEDREGHRSKWRWRWWCSAGRGAGVGAEAGEGGGRGAACVLAVAGGGACPFLAPAGLPSAALQSARLESFTCMHVRLSITPPNNVPLFSLNLILWGAIGRGSSTVFAPTILSRVLVHAACPPRSPPTAHRGTAPAPDVRRGGSDRGGTAAGPIAAQPISMDYGHSAPGARLRATPSLPRRSAHPRRVPPLWPPASMTIQPLLV